MRSSVRMQCISTWTSPVGQNSLPSPHQTLSSMPFDQTHMGYYNVPQKSFDEQSVRLRNHTFFQPISSSANLQSNQTPQTWSSGSRSYSTYVSSASRRHPPPNIVPYSSLQVGPLNGNLNYNTSVLNTTSQRNLNSVQNGNYTAPHFSVLSVPSNTNGVSNNSYCMHGSSPPWQHPVNRQNHRIPTTWQPAAQAPQAALTINMNQGQMSVVGQHNETSRSVAHFETASHTPLSHRKHAGYVKLKHSLHRKTPPPPYRARLNSVIQNQSNQRPNQVSPSLTQKIQSQTPPISGGQRNTNFATFPAIQSSTQQQDLHSNTLSGLATNSKDKTSFSPSTSQPSPASCSGSIKSSHSILVRLLLDNTGSQQSIHDITAGHKTTVENDKQGKTRQRKKYKKPAKETGISRRNEIGNGSHQAGPQKSSQNEMTNQKKRNEKVQSCIDLPESRELRMVRQVNKIVAVVSPISQQVSSHGQQNTTSPHDSLPLKTDTVKNCENMDTNVTSWLIEDLPHVPSSPSSTINSSADISEMPTSENDPTSGSQSCDISQCENDFVPATQIPSKGQDTVCVVGSTSTGSLEQNDDQKVESSSENTTLDLSTVPVVDYTLKELKDLVNSLEVKPTERDKLRITDVVKCIIDLYHDGDEQNLVTLLASNEPFTPSSELCVKEMHAVVLQYLETKHLKMLGNCSQILANEITIPSEDFRSSWLNVNGQPANVENVPAEPVSEYNLTWYQKVAQSVSESVVNVVGSLAKIGTDNAEDLGVHACRDIPKSTKDNILKDMLHSDPEHSTVIFAANDCKEDMMILEKGCVSGTANELSNKQRKSKNQFSQQLHDEVDTLKESKQAFTEQSLSSSSDECGRNNSDEFENTDTSDEADSTTDLPDIIPLLTEDARKIFSECFECDQKKEPHQMCQEERKDLVTHCAKKQSDSFKGTLNDFKFTCPHMPSLANSSDFFCPSCWNETPLLEIDQDETLFTPKEEELDTEFQRRSCNSHSGKPIEYPSVPVCLESSSINMSVIATPRSDGSDVMRTAKPGDQTQSSSPPSTQELHHGIGGTKNSSTTKSVAEDLQNITSSAGPKTEHLDKEGADFPSGMKISTGIVSPSRNSSSVPEINDILFSPGIVIRNTSTHKQHPHHKSKTTCNFPVKKTCLDQLSTKTKRGTPSQTSHVSGTPKCKNAVPHKQKRQIIKEKGHGGQSKETKKVRLELYGSKSSFLGCNDKKKLFSTPVYLTITPSPSIGKSCTNEPSAKQKIYSQWSATFIHR